MKHVDALSRYSNVLETNVVDITEGEWIVAAQLQDEQLVRVRNILERKRIDSETKHYFEEYELKLGKIYRKLTDGNKLWVVPKATRWQICILCHDKAGHLEVEDLREGHRCLRAVVAADKMKRWIVVQI